MRTLVAIRVRKLATQPPPLTVLTLGVGYVLTLAALDFHTRSTLDFTLLYLIGVGFVAWGAGLWHATSLSVFCAAIFHLDASLAALPRPEGLIMIWNESTRFLVFIAAGWLTATASHLIRRLSHLVETGIARAQAEANQHKATAARLAQKELLYRTLFELCPDGILLEDGNGNILDANQAICQISGYSLEELLSQNVRRFVPPEKHPEMERHLAALRAGQSLQHEVWNVRRNGQPCLLALHEKPIALPDGQLGILVVAHDITERKRLERQLVEISDREQAHIGQDLHDGLCQQLVSLAFDANGLEKQLAATGRPEAATARRIAVFLDHAITEARQLARGLFPIRLAAHGLPSALEELANTTCDRFKVACHFVSETPVALPGESLATHLFRIAQEAVTNALKHARPKLIIIGLRVRDSALELRVEDDGIGIAESPKSPTGMGLHIMDYRARSIGGRLRVAPGVRGGTMVTCCLALPPG